MKIRHLGILLLLAVLSLTGCDDTTNTLGMGMLPGSDGINVNTATFEVTTRSILADSVYAKTSTGYVGRFSDPEFGYFESSFLTELNCTDNFTFPSVYQYNEATKRGSGTMAGDSVVSIQLVIYYSTWFGDSLNACRMSVYELDRRLDKNRYTNIDPQEYYQPAGLIGRKAYTAYDTTVPDSIRNATDYYGNKTYMPNITFPIDKKRGNEILHLNREHPEYFKDADAFIDNVFKGVYVKSDYGDGTILNISYVDLQMQFRFHYTDSLGVALKKADGTDSLYYSMATVFASTKEVIQANQFSNSDILKKKVEEELDHTYIKSPAGIFTEATMPYDAIHEQLSSDTLNAVRLTFTNYNQETPYEFSMSAPSYVLLLRKQDVKTFFEENQLPDNVTSFIVAHNNVGTNQYTFSNVARLVSSCINEKNAARNEARQKAGSSWDETQWERDWLKEHEDWDKVVLVPVSATYDSNSSSSYYSSSSPTLIRVENDLQPGYARLKGGPQGEKLQIEVTYTTFNE